MALDITADSGFENQSARFLQGVNLQLISQVGIKEGDQLLVPNKVVWGNSSDNESRPAYFAILVLKNPISQVCTAIRVYMSQFTNIDAETRQPVNAGNVCDYLVGGSEAFDLGVGGKILKVGKSMPKNKAVYVGTERARAASTIDEAGNTVNGAFLYKPAEAFKIDVAGKWDAKLTEAIKTAVNDLIVSLGGDTTGLE